VGLINIGAQPLSLGSGCVFTGIIQHEALHALGFFHEQSRPDRDDYVIVNFTNIISGLENNFEKYTTFVDVYGLPYDYGSLMHYGQFDFSSNGNPTIIPKNTGVTIGNREKMSDYDIEAVRLHYPTNNSLSTTTTISTTSTTTTTTITTTSTTTTTTIATTSTSSTRNNIKTTPQRKRQRSKVTRSLQIVVELSEFDNNEGYRNNLTSIIKTVGFLL
jgi:hypothetical protein